MMIDNAVGCGKIALVETNNSIAGRLLYNLPFDNLRIEVKAPRVSSGLRPALFVSTTAGYLCGAF